MTTANVPPESLAAALALLQTRLPKIGKDKTAKVRTKAGIEYSYDYANLTTISAAVLPLMGDLGLSFTACPTLTSDERRQFVLEYELLHASGEGKRGAYPLPSGGSPQEIGSAITYARRYCLCAITGVAPDEDDDDAQAAEAAVRPARMPTAKKPARGKPGPQPLSGAALKAHEALEPAPVAHGDNYSRGNATPADDPWLTVDANGERHPPGQAPPAVAAMADQASSGQRGIIRTHFTRLGFEDHDREERLVITGMIAGVPDLASTNDLTQAQARTVMDALSRCRDRPSLMRLPAMNPPRPTPAPAAAGTGSTGVPATAQGARAGGEA